MGRILGLDSGGTKTVVAIAERSGRVVALAHSAGLDPIADDQWESHLAALLAPLGPVEAAVLGLPFHGEMPEISARQQAAATRLLGPAARAMNDVAVAFEGALVGEEGVLVLAGTGSMSWARGPRGERRCGGWGDAIGDEGSAYWIGREALGIASRMVDGRQACGAFADGLLGALGITGDDLIGWIYRQPQPRAAIASVARHISAMAARGDWVAKGLMERASEHLSVLGHAVARQAGLAAPLRWSYAGGVFADAGLLRAVSMRMGSEPVLPRLPPVGGAILCAARTAGWAVDEAFVTTLSQSLGEEAFQENNPQSPTQE